MGRSDSPQYSQWLAGETCEATFFSKSSWRGHSLHLAAPWCDVAAFHRRPKACHDAGWLLSRRAGRGQATPAWYTHQQAAPWPLTYPGRGELVFTARMILVVFWRLLARICSIGRFFCATELCNNHDSSLFVGIESFCACAVSVSI